MKRPSPNSMAKYFIIVSVKNYLIDQITCFIHLMEKL